MNTLASSQLTPVQAQAISALADGELRGDELASTLPLLCGSDELTSQARSTWHTYHVIGEAMRAGAGSASGVHALGNADFVQRLHARLAQEPLPQAQDASENAIKLIASYAVNTRANAQLDSIDLPPGRPQPQVPQQPQQQAANDSFWKLAAGFASVVALGALAWNLLGTGQGSGAQLAQKQNQNTAVVAGTPQPVPGQPNVVLVSTPQGDMLRDARLVQMMAAHKQMGGASGLQMPTGFLRNATFAPAQQ
jgi:sigma-E factor negative regulatory protein RseA